MAEEIKSSDGRAFSGLPMFIAWAAMLLFAFHASTHMVAAGDTWVAMACGRHFINHGVDTVEPFSANSHKAGPTEEEVAKWPGWAQWATHKIGLENMKKIHPTGWVNQNWLTHVIFYWLTHDSPVADAENYSFNTLVYWKIALYIASVICIYYTGRILGVNPALAAVFACFAMFIARSFLDVRPAGFSNLLVAVFLLILVLATYRNILYLWLIIPLSVFWCNVHGGYIYVFIMLTAFFSLHFLLRLPIRWTTVLYCIAFWAGSYLLSVKFLSYEPTEYLRPVFERVNVLKDQLFYLILLLCAGGIILSVLQKIKSELFYSYHLISTFIVVTWSFTRFFTRPQTRNFSQALLDIVRDDISSFQQSFLLTISILVCLGLVLMLLKDRMVRYSPRQIAHVGAVGIVTFFACLIFNPFHLTNFTHTFVISLSKHAEMWRTVHEWHPAFAWSNPVGAGFPYMVLLILIIGLGIMWLFSRYMASRLPGIQYDSAAGKKKFSILSTIIGCALAIFTCYITYVSLSFCPAVSGLVVCILFAGIILLSVLLNVHIIYVTIPIIMIVIEATKIYSASTGRTTYPGTYIYPFLIIPTFVGIFTVASLVSKKPNYKPINIVFVILTAIAAVLLMSGTINPLKLKSISECGSTLKYFEQYLNITRPWRPPYEANLGTLSMNYKQYLFTGLYIANILSAGLWFIIPAIKNLFAGRDVEAESRQGKPDYSVPKFDLAYLFVVLLTVYMAYRSRRFIPIAGFAACPIVAMFINDIAKAFSASFSFHKAGKFVVPGMPRQYQRFFVVVGALVFVVFGTWCGLRFKSVYLNPWPLDQKLTSIFMRMTASHAKPFWTLQFIRENHLSGKMFNYWTEGGFIAYGQTPDPNTGKTPLQLFMDGRAQAAYDPDAFQRWGNLMSGTEVGAQLTRASRARGRSRLTGAEYLTIGKAVSEELRKDEVWVVLMPMNVREAIIIEGLGANPDWALVFYNDKQKLYVDTRTERGLALFEGIANGTTWFPDEFSKRLTIADSILAHNSDPEATRLGLENAIAAMKANPSQIAMLEVLSAQKSQMPIVASFCKQYVDDFIENKKTYEKENGYMNRMAAAALANNFMSQLIRDQQEKAKYQEQLKGWSEEMRKINENWAW